MMQLGANAPSRDSSPISRTRLDFGLAVRGRTRAMTIVAPPWVAAIGAGSRPFG